MANEATLMNQDSDIHYFAWTAASALAKGAIVCVAPDADRKATAHTGNSQVFLGVAAAENTAGEANGNVSVRTRGIMTMTAGGTISRGNLVGLDSTSNRVVALSGAAASMSQLNQLVGVALGAATTGTTLDVLVGGVR